MILWQPPKEDDPAITLHPKYFTAFITKLARAVRYRKPEKEEGN